MCEQHDSSMMEEFGTIHGNICLTLWFQQAEERSTRRFRRSTAPTVGRQLPGRKARERARAAPSLDLVNTLLNLVTNRLVMRTLPQCGHQWGSYSIVRCVYDGRLVADISRRLPEVNERALLR